MHDRKFLLAVKNVTLIEEKKIPDSFSEQFDDTTRKRRIYIKIVMNYIPTLCTTTTDAKENKDDFDFFFNSGFETLFNARALFRIFFINLSFFFIYLLWSP